MSILQNKLARSNWLDICSGSGVIGCEALQRGAQRIMAIEKNKKTARICKLNLISSKNRLFQKNLVEVICFDAQRVLLQGCLKRSIKFKKEFPDIDPRFDFVYIDPPYSSGIYYSLLEKLLTGNWVKNKSLVICEHSSKDMPSIPPGWVLQEKRVYGDTALLLLTPNQSLHFLFDTDFKQQHISQG